MKKLVILIIIILFSACSYINYVQSSYLKVFKINSPNELFIDLNKNFIFDENKPYKIKNLHYISDFSENVTKEQKLLFEYFAYLEAKKLAINVFVKIKDGDLIIRGKSYKDTLLNTDYFYSDSEDSVNKFKNNLKKYNTDDYFILNTKNKKYHKLNCSNGQNIKNMKIIHRSELPQEYKTSKCCLNEIEKSHPKTFQQNIKNNILDNGNFKIFFIDLFSVNKPDNYCKTDACRALKDKINKAVNTIDFAIYGFNNEPEIYKALENAQNRGVKIRWVSNYDNSENAYYPDLDMLKKLLPQYKTNKSDKSDSKLGLMHNKFFIFDDESVFTGSANITSTDLSGFNANYAILIESKEAAKIYKSEFEQMYSGNFGKNKQKINKNTIEFSSGRKIKIMFSPKDDVINSCLIKLIDEAKQYIYIPAFFITDKRIQEALIEANKRHIDIKVINDATNASSKYTIHKNLRNNEIAVKTENYAGKMHSKSFIIDDKYTVIGSMNFTSSGNKRNDENIVLIEDTKTAKFMKETFMHIWNKIPDKYLKYDPRAESLESIGSCYDGIDNDFDNKIDAMDEGCIIKQY